MLSNRDIYDNSILENYDIYNANIKYCKSLIKYKLKLYYIGNKYHFIKEKNLSLLIQGDTISIYNESELKNDSFSIKLYYSEVKICQINSGLFAILKRDTIFFLNIEYDSQNQPITITFPKIINLEKNYNNIEYLDQNHLIVFNYDSFSLFIIKKNGIELKIKDIETLFGMYINSVKKILFDKENNQHLLIDYNSRIYFYEINRINEDNDGNIKMKYYLKKLLNIHGINGKELDLKLLDKDNLICYNNATLFLISLKYLEIISIYNIFKKKNKNKYNIIINPHFGMPLQPQVKRPWIKRRSFLKYSLFILNNTKMVLIYNIYNHNLKIYKYINNLFLLRFRCCIVKEIIDIKIINNKKEKIIISQANNRKITNDNDYYIDDDYDDNSINENDYYNDDDYDDNSINDKDNNNNSEYNINNYYKKPFNKKYKQRLKDKRIKKLKEKSKKISKKIKININNDYNIIDIFNY